MKYIFWTLLMASGVQAACLPESSDKINFKNEITENEFAIESFVDIVKADLPPEIDLIVKVDSLNNRLNAEVFRENNKYIIQIFGGMIRHPEMNQDAIKLLLCHELGHFRGGPPLKSRGGWSSTEGQADYFSTQNCAHLFEFDEQSFIDAAIRLTSLYATVSRQMIPVINSCDENEVSSTNYGYPTAQCRFDTLLAGWGNLKRPKCWFAN